METDGGGDVLRVAEPMDTDGGGDVLRVAEPGGPVAPAAGPGGAVLLVAEPGVPVASAAVCRDTQEGSAYGP